ncbi:MAG: class I SAM-dependent methyltransferase [Casimicrobiaceae bacterium]
MLERPAALSNYDRIAHLYDIDMGRNMAFDDAAFYVEQAARAGGRVLELGCGNGRILLELVRHGVNAVGIDASARMLLDLRRKATAHRLEATVCRMDARALAFSDAFALVLCPYSLITYMTATEDAARLLAGIHAALAPAGTVIVDAFIPRQGAPSDAFKVDYRREHRNGVLVRSKRVAALGPSTHRIERRYELVAADGRLVERIDTSEDIRLYWPKDIVELLTTSGFAIDRTWRDYGATPAGEAQFFTVSARKSS